MNANGKSGILDAHNILTLENVLPDFRFRDGVPPDLERERIFELVPSGTHVETATIQQIVSIVVDPHGKGLEDHCAGRARCL